MQVVYFNFAENITWTKFARPHFHPLRCFTLPQPNRLKPVVFRPLALSVGPVLPAADVAGIRISLVQEGLRVVFRPDWRRLWRSPLIARETQGGPYSNPPSGRLTALRKLVSVSFARFSVRPPPEIKPRLASDGKLASLFCTCRVSCSWNVFVITVKLVAIKKNYVTPQPMSPKGFLLCFQITTNIELLFK